MRILKTLKISIIIIILIIISCREEEKYTFYDMYLKNDSFPSGSYKVFDNGECYYYIYNRQTRKRERFEVEDVITTHKIEYEGNNKILINGYEHRFIKIFQDTIFLFNIGRKDIERYIKTN